MEWFVVTIITLILAATLFVVRRSGRAADFTLSAGNQYDRDLNLRTRMAEDEARDAIHARERDVAP